MRTLSCDIETYSNVELQKSGVYAYTASPHFEILLFAYAFDNEPVKLVDIASGEQIPEEIINAIKDESIIKTAFNAMFERVCLSKHLGTMLSPVSWQCTAVQSAMLGLPLSLDGVASVLALEKQKLSEGKDLIKYFSKPCRPTKKNGGRTRNFPHHDRIKWQTFKDYCIRDVEVEMAIREKIKKFPIPEIEQQYYVLDQKINDRGILADLDFVKQAISCDERFRDITLSRACDLTGLSNPNSVIQLKGWLEKNNAVVDSLSKKDVGELANDAAGDVLEMLKLRLLLSKTSIKKYEAIMKAVCPDNRVRGLFQFYGANRTGRFAGRLVQVQNLPQNHIPDLEIARDIVKQGAVGTLELLYDNVPNVLSELIRTAFIPKPEHRFIVADFSAIEARVIAWLANEKWRMDVFATHGKIYEASASQMFKVPIEEITKGSPLRQKGKISELALGYGGSVGALTAMGALDMGIQEEELINLVSSWRRANPNITKLWWDIDAAAIKAVRERKAVKVGRVTLHYESGIFFITLPSGRKLSYIKPRLELNKFGRESLNYEGIGLTKRWERIDSYGPKFVENIVQAIARDLLVGAMKNVADKGYNIVMHVHDEIVIEAPNGNGSLEDVCEIMAQMPEWTKGLLMRADGYECNFYRKE